MGQASTPTAIYPRFAYVANVSSDTVSQYVVDAETGQLRPNGYVSTGIDPYLGHRRPQRTHRLCDEPRQRHGLRSTASMRRAPLRP